MKRENAKLCNAEGPAALCLGMGLASAFAAGVWQVQLSPPPSQGCALYPSRPPPSPPPPVLLAAELGAIFFSCKCCNLGVQAAPWAADWFPQL